MATTAIVMALAIPNAYAPAFVMFEGVETNVHHLASDVHRAFESIRPENSVAQNLVGFTGASIRYRSVLDRYSDNHDQALRLVSQQLNGLRNVDEGEFNRFITSLDEQLRLAGNVRISDLPCAVGALEHTLNNVWRNSDGSINNPTLMFQSYLIGRFINGLLAGRHHAYRIQLESAATPEVRRHLFDASRMMRNAADAEGARPSFRSALSSIPAIETQRQQPGRFGFDENDPDDLPPHYRRMLERTQQQLKIAMYGALITTFVAACGITWYSHHKLHKKYGSHLFDAIRYKHLGLKLPDAKAQLFAQEYHEADDQREYLLGLHVFLNPQNVLRVTKAAGIHGTEE